MHSYFKYENTFMCIIGRNGGWFELECSDIFCERNVKDNCFQLKSP